MEKLSKLNQKLFKKGMQIAALTGALATAGVMMGGCQQPSDDGTVIENPNGGNNPTIDDPTIDDPTIGDNQGGNQQGGNQQGGNQGGNQQGGNQGGNTGNQGGNEQTDGKYTAPFDKELGNGNYVAHAFSGAGFVFQPNSIYEDVSYYLDKGQTYYNERVNQFEQSVNGRTTYFNDYISRLNNNSSNFQFNEYTPGGFYMDFAMNGITGQSESIFKDIIKNLGNTEERNTFMVCYGALSNEAYKVGLTSTSQQLEGYNTARQTYNKYWNNWNISESFDLNNDIDNNNCYQITNTMDKLLQEAANNIGQNVTAADLRQVVNMTYIADSLQAMHDRTKNNLKHNSCVTNNKIWDAMDQAANEAWEAEQQTYSVVANQNQGLTR